MSESRTGESLGTEVAELRRRLEAIQRELEPGDRRRLRPPTLRELRRFTADVTIPAIVLVLETNVRALELLQRAIQVSGEGEDEPSEGAPPVGDRAAEASAAALRRLDDALADLQRSVGTRGDPEFADLLSEARDLQQRVERRLTAGTEPGPGAVTIDVEAELESIKDDLDEDDPRDTE